MASCYNLIIVDNNAAYRNFTFFLAGKASFIASSIKVFIHLKNPPKFVSLFTASIIISYMIKYIITK